MAAEEEQKPLMAADDEGVYMSIEQIDDTIRKLRSQMEAAAKELNFIEAARLRDELFAYQALAKEKR